MLLAILSFFIVLVPLVIIHELGHFIAAKNVGITVLEFGIGFPPRMAVLFTRGETEYTLNILPLGGFVRPYGEDFVRPKTEEEMQDDLKEIEGRKVANPKSVFEAGPWERIWFMLAGPIANFIAAFVIFVLIGITGIPEAVAEVSLAQVFEGSPADVAGLQVGDVVTHVDGERVETVSQFEDAVEDQDELLLRVKRGDETFDAVVVPGPFDAGGVKEQVLIARISEGTPAEAAGLEADDVIIAVDGQPVIDIDMLVDYTDEREDVPIQFTIARGADIIEKMITPEKINGDVQIGIRISPAPLDETIGATTANRDVTTVSRPAENLVDAVSYGGGEIVRTMELMVEAPLMIIRGEISGEQARPVSPVGISQMGGAIIEESQEAGALYPILYFAAIISIALAVTNLLPIPGLDGGRILFVIFELVRGKPMEPEREGLVHMIGILFLLSIMFVVIVMDIVNPIDLSSF